ncbi:MAG: malonyl-CoA decarboxylase, partial [Rhodospirillales bacterium]
MTDVRTPQRFVARLKQAWRGLSTGAMAAVGAPRIASPDLVDADLPLLRARLLDCLVGRGGEASARARAAELGQTYLGLSIAGRKRFMQLLASDFDIDRAAAADAAAQALKAWQSGEAKAVRKAEAS